ncbi:Hypothetical protein CAP_7280 [Chondromyces apiculatus DSM 436]|uniref:Uncharacterized protein n=1 Tax=Chondromyces apiculatus DSM 436 TaxID=1192034 RepID=A0A017T1A7_9BACT|nr:Hypothetical protein CAP_7280 [Chondromyces apiculatus DSM 436]
MQDSSARGLTRVMACPARAALGDHGAIATSRGGAVRVNLR